VLVQSIEHSNGTPLKHLHRLYLFSLMNIFETDASASILRGPELLRADTVLQALFGRHYERVWYC
jgi:hypothetical protein